MPQVLLLSGLCLCVSSNLQIWRLGEDLRDFSEGLGFQPEISSWDDKKRGSQLQDPGVWIQVILYALLGVLYTLVVITSYLADYLFIKHEQRSLYGSLA